jgi:hypothetical protein
MNQHPRPARLGYAGLVESLFLLGAAVFRNGATMGNRFCSLLLSLAWLFVGYPANLLADALDTARYRHQTPFDLLRQGSRTARRRRVDSYGPYGRSIGVHAVAVAAAGLRLRFVRRGQFPSAAPIAGARPLWSPESDPGRGNQSSQPSKRCDNSSLFRRIVLSRLWW